METYAHCHLERGRRHAWGTSGHELSGGMIQDVTWPRVQQVSANMRGDVSCDVLGPVIAAALGFG